MPNGAALVSVMKVVVVVMMLMEVDEVEAAPTERGFVKPLPGLTRAEKSSAPNPSQYLKNWLLSTKAAGADGTTRTTDKATARTAGPDKRAQMLKMISALEELHRTFNSTLSSRITIIPRASGRNSVRRNKVPPAADSGVKPTTAAAALAAVDSTASRASAIVPGLTGRNFKKSLPTQTKKTNKRVCFWKYCSQN